MKSNTTVGRVHSVEKAQTRSRSSGLWLRWTLFVTVGELLGFAAPVVTGMLAYAAGLPETLVWAFAILGGAVEGAALGLMQWLVLSPFLPNLTRRAWVIATAAGAVLAYVIAFIVNQLGDPSTLTRTPLLVIAIVVLAFALLLSLGGAQSLVLRFHLRGALWWVLANAAAWLLGVAMPFITIGMVPDGSPFAVAIAAGIVGGVLMGFVVGAVTGVALVWLFTSQDR